MAFSTRVLKNWQAECSQFRRRTSWWLYLLAIALLSPTTHASDFSISGIHTEVKEGVYLLDANVDYRFSEEPLQALSNGVPLTIALTIEIDRVRNWWLNEEIAELEQRYSLQYHPLSHQYLLRNLNSGAIYNYPNYLVAVESMGAIQDLPLLDSKLILPQEQYRVSIRAELDIEALPSPLRPVAYITPQWRLKSDWYSWPLKP